MKTQVCCPHSQEWQPREVVTKQSQVYQKKTTFKRDSQQKKRLHTASHNIITLVPAVSLLYQLWQQEAGGEGQRGPVHMATSVPPTAPPHFIKHRWSCEALEDDFPTLVQHSNTATLLFPL